MATASFKNVNSRELSEPALGIRFLINLGRKFIPTISPSSPVGVVPGAAVFEDFEEPLTTETPQDEFDNLFPGEKSEGGITETPNGEGNDKDPQVEQKSAFIPEQDEGESGVTSPQNEDEPPTPPTQEEESATTDVPV